MYNMAATKHPRKKKHSVEYFIINIFVFFCIWILSQIVINVALFNVFTNAFKDFTLTDSYYKMKSDSLYKDSLVLVNIDTLQRQDIALLLKKVEMGKPKVVGVDAIFDARKDSAGDQKLKEVLTANDNIVLPYSGTSTDFSNPSDSTGNFLGLRPSAYANVVGSGTDSLSTTLRYYYPAMGNNISFSTAIMKKFDSERAEKLLKRKDKKTEIKYFGNLDHFHSFSYSDILDPGFNVDTLKGRIILLGYWDSSDKNPSLEDRYFTPLNPVLSGRSHPDMYGVVIQANILRMSMDNDFLYSLPEWMNWLLAFMISWLMLPLFIRWWVHKAVWFHLNTMLLQLFISILFVFLSLFLYSRGVKIESHSILIAILLMGDFILLYDSLVQFFKRKLNWNFHSKFFEGSH
jgi:CHASE2 domain-containing sensor protein